MWFGVKKTTKFVHYGRLVHEFSVISTTMALQGVVNETDTDPTISSVVDDNVTVFEIIGVAAEETVIETLTTDGLQPSAELQDEQTRPIRRVHWIDYEIGGECNDDEDVHIIFGMDDIERCSIEKYRQKNWNGKGAKLNPVDVIIDKLRGKRSRWKTDDNFRDRIISQHNYFQRVIRNDAVTYVKNIILNLALTCGLRGTNSSFSFGDIGKYMKMNNNYISWLVMFYIFHGAFDENDGWHKDYEQKLMKSRGWEYEIDSSSVSRDDSIAPTGFIAKIISYIKSGLVKNLNENLSRNTGRYIVVTQRNMAKEDRKKAQRKRSPGFNAERYVRRHEKKAQLEIDLSLPTNLVPHVNRDGFVDISRAVMTGLLPRDLFQTTGQIFKVPNYRVGRNVDEMSKVVNGSNNQEEEDEDNVTEVGQAGLVTSRDRMNSIELGVSANRNENKPVASETTREDIRAARQVQHAVEEMKDQHEKQNQKERELSIKEVRQTN